MKRTTRVALLTTLVALMLFPSGCGGGKDVFSSGCDLGPCAGGYRGRTSGIGGTAYTVRAAVNSGTVSVTDFYASCRGVYPDGRSCGYTLGTVGGAAGSLDGSCRFTVRAQGSENGVPVTVRIEGSFDQATCKVSGSYDLDYGTCCSATGSWSATKF